MVAISFRLRDSPSRRKVSTALNKIYDDARRDESARLAPLRQQQTNLSPRRGPQLSRLWRFLRTSRPAISLQPASDEPMTRERLAAGQPPN
jgi:hypothetical protein